MPVTSNAGRESSEWMNSGANACHDGHPAGDRRHGALAPHGTQWRRTILMGAHMFDAARAMVLASLPADLSEPERKAWLFQHFYGQPLPSDE